MINYICTKMEDMCMKKLQPMGDVLLSWRRCMEEGVSSKLLAPSVFMKGELLKKERRKNSLLISVFEEYGIKNSNLMGLKHLLLLFNSEGVLLKIAQDKVKKSNHSIVEGAIFTEDSCGTNAIAMSMNLKKPVLTFPNYHYCEFLRNYYLYAIPLFINEKLKGYLSIFILDRQIIGELITIVDLLGYQICNEYKISANRITNPDNCSCKLSVKQLVVLKLLSRGLTDKAIAIETGLSFATVRYHKKNIFRNLGVSSSLEAVVKALKLNFILLDDIVI